MEKVKKIPYSDYRIFTPPIYTDSYIFASITGITFLLLPLVESQIIGLATFLFLEVIFIYFVLLLEKKKLKKYKENLIIKNLFEDKD